VTSSRRQLLRGAGAAALLAQLQSIRGEAWAAAGAAATTAGDAPERSPWRRHYALAPGLIYLNHAAVGTVPLVVQTAHEGYLRLCETNPWLYMWSEPWIEPREAVRARAAALLGCDWQELAITHNTTEFFNTLAQGLPLGAGDEVLFSSLNHSGASVCWEHHAVTKGYEVRRFDFPLAGIASLSEDEIVERHRSAIGPRTRVLVLPHVDNTIGLRHPVARIAAAARARGVRWIAVDGAQTVGMVPVDVRALDADFFATSCHKWLQSPKGLGLAYARRELQAELRPMWVTWGQEYWHGDARVYEDYGTRAMAMELALGDALEFQASVDAAERDHRYRGLYARLRELVDGHERLIWRSPGSWDLGASLVAIEVRGRPSAEIAERLFEEQGIVVRPFSVPGLDALRVSPNLANDEQELERFVGAVID
jgi:selenocysteine lyase/cysteine desulfurase